VGAGMSSVSDGSENNRANNIVQGLKKANKSTDGSRASLTKCKKNSLISSLFICGSTLDVSDPQVRKYNIEVLPVSKILEDPPLDYDDQSTGAESSLSQESVPSDVFQEAQAVHEYIMGVMQKGSRTVPSGKGFHGSVFLEDDNGEELGVWKPEEKRSIGDHFRQKGLLLSEGVKDPLAVGEEAAYLLSEKLGFTGFVPKTAFISSQGKALAGADAKGSFQEFGGDFAVATIAVASRLDNPNTSPTEKETILFQKMASLDFILGNVDRHAENWMVKTDLEGQITKIILIDNGSSIPRKYTTGGMDYFTKMAAHNQYNWATFISSDKPFDQEVSDFIKGIDEKALDDVFNYLDSDHPGYLSQSMKRGVQERLRILKKAAGGGVTARDSVRGRTREFHLKDLFLFMDGKKSQQALAQGEIFWDPKLRGIFNKNRNRNIQKKRQIDHAA
jgi:hypothetical protein